MTERIIETAKAAGYELAPMIDKYAVQADLDRFDKTGRAAYYMLMPKQEERRFDLYGISTVTRMQLVAASRTAFSDDGRKDFNIVSQAVESLKRDLTSIVGALMETERYENISRITFDVFPREFDSQVTVVIATFNLEEAEPTC